jgi:DNA-binding response OmpR family regulator
MTGGSETVSPGPCSVLLLESQPELRARFSEALRSAGITVTEAARLGDVERWPSGQTVVTDAERFTTWWKQVGAEHVIVLAATEREGINACSSGATTWLPRSCGPEELVETVVKLGRGR